MGSPASIDWINLLAFGLPGCGKTWFLGTAEDHADTSPLLILDVEGGSKTLRKRTNIDVVQVRSIDEIAGWHKRLMEENDVLGYKTIGIDSGSELAKLDMREIMLKAKNDRPDIEVDVPGFREWGIAGEHMRRIIRAYRDLPMNFIFTSHVDIRQDDLNRTTYAPMFSGKLRVEAPGFLDIVGYMTTKIEDDITTRIMQFAQTNRVTAKDRTDSLGDFLENATIPMIWDLIHS